MEEEKHRQAMIECDKSVKTLESIEAERQGIVQVDSGPQGTEETRRCSPVECLPEPDRGGEGGKWKAGKT